MINLIHEFKDPATRQIHVWLAAFGLGAALICPVRAEDRRTDTTQVTIMHLNAEFLWDGIAPEEGDASVHFDWRGSPVEAAAHMQAVAAIINRNNPDIISLCEVENKDALDKLNTDFLAGKGYKTYFAQGTDTTTGQDMGFLTRIDPEGNAIAYDNRKGHSGAKDKSCSKDYVAKLTINGEKIAMIGAHLRAHPDQSSIRLDRQAQADALRQMAVEVASEGFQPIILGDMNDFDDDACCIDKNGNHPITTVLKILKEMDPSNSGDDLINISSLLPQPERYTDFWDRNNDGQLDPATEVSELDHFLIAPGLLNNVDSVLFDHTHDPRQHPDHYPIVVHILFSGGGTVPPGQSMARISELLPNPSGDETQNEQVTLVNKGTASVDFQGWKLRDLAHTTWSLNPAGSLAAGASVVVRRNGQQMALNNGGDTIELLNDQGTAVQTVTYGRATQGEVIVVP
jgi:endonuclease/exonuclease/phosphatase family metal-dependent hydrolase